MKPLKISEPPSCSEPEDLAEEFEYLEASGAPVVGRTGESSTSQMAIMGYGERRSVVGVHKMWWDKERNAWYDPIIDAVFIDNPDGRQQWYNKKHKVWLNEEESSWYRWSQPRVDVGKGKAREGTKSRKVNVKLKEDLDIDFCEILRDMGEAMTPHVSFLESVCNEVGSLVLRACGKVRIHIYHYTPFNRPHEKCMTTHKVDAKMMVRSLFHMHRLEGGVEPAEGMALEQLGHYNIVGANNNVKAYYWNPGDETTIQQMKWNFIGDEAWLDMTSS